jgi:asparagine synthase (glutamine-hydrolysing)
MCGICGKFSPKGVTQEDIRPMLEVLAHRGPDDEGMVVKDRIGLGNRRLSVIDLSGGHQPISNEDGSIWIVYNGEIYNHRLLREMLEEKGHIFRTNSDTEVIVHLYEEFGEGCVSKLRGMFAFAIWDENQQKLILARDHLGQKPLFYSQIGHDFWFASEIKSILAGNNQMREMDLESLHHYLSLRFIPSPRTMLQGIQKLPPAHLLVFQNGEIRTSRYWQLSFQQNLDFREEELIEGLREKLVETVAKHLISDVSIGAFLSGGLDSAMIVAIIAKDLNLNLKTFAVGVKEQDFDETPYARMVAQRYNTDHIEEHVKADLIRSLPEIIWHLDEPSDPIAACMYQAGKLASRHVKVVLGGDGGDELFAGFDRYQGNGYIKTYRLLPTLFRERIIASFLEQIPDNFTYNSTTQKFRWVHQLSKISDPGERYAAATCFFRFNHQAKHELYASTLWNQLHTINSTSVIAQQYDLADSEKPLDRMLFADYLTRLPEHSLMLIDRMTMAHGLEARSPFLDHELVEYMATFPSHIKIKGRQSKYLLRQLAREYLPETIVNRRKQGFGFPIAYWSRKELFPILDRFLMDSFFIRDGLFRRENIHYLLESHKNNRVDHHVRLWMLLNLEIWHQLVIENRQVKDVTENIQEHLYTKI